jgi:uncharacterized membrane protein YeaQ/YmgE (transglycosylase-associated protein family)
MGILSWILLGLVAGWLAGMLMRGGGYGILGDIILGIVGALVGGFISGALFGIDVSGCNFTSVVVATLGAVIVIAIARALTPARHPTV